MATGKRSYKRRVKTPIPEDDEEDDDEANRVSARPAISSAQSLELLTRVNFGCILPEARAGAGEAEEGDG